jgi:hypothetical protein
VGGGGGVGVKGKTCMVEEPSHIKQLSLNHVCKIGLSLNNIQYINVSCLLIDFKRKHQERAFLINVYCLFYILQGLALTVWTASVSFWT